MSVTSLMESATKPPTTDGRTLRRSRNRAAVVDAMVALIREGDRQPSAVDIADRAGVSHRSIFRYFDDLDDLMRTSIDRAFVEARSIGRIEHLGEGTLDERIAAFTDARLALYRHVDGAMQVSRMKAPSIPAIDETIGRIAKTSRTQISRHFAPEVAARSATDAELLVDAVLVASSYDAFTIHVRLLDSSPERMRASMIYSLSALLRI